MKPALGDNSQRDILQHRRNLAGAPIALYCLAGTFLFLGAGGLGYVHTTADPLFLSLAFLVIGCAASFFLGGARMLNVHAFVLTYCFCVFVAGAAHLYSFRVFNMPQSFPDANFYYKMMNAISIKAGLFSLSYRINSPLAIYLWKRLYWLYDLFALKGGIWGGVLFNCEVIALSAAVTVRAAFDIFGKDEGKLRSIGIWSALNGLNWLCAAIFIRDGFLALVNAFSLWVFVRLLKGSKHEIWCLAALAFLAFCSYGFRPSTLPLFLLLCAVCGLCWFQSGKISPLRLLFLLSIPVVMALSFAILQSYIVASSTEFTSVVEQYNEIGATASKSDSLAMQLIVNQPIPIRLPLAVPALLILPTPLWSHLTYSGIVVNNIQGISEYHLIKTYIGIFMLFFMPFVLASAIRGIDLVLRGKDKNKITLFLLIYLAVSISAVAMSSLDNRHLAQFMPAMLLFILLPDKKDLPMRTIVPLSFIIWWGGVLLAHLLWAAMRFL